MITKFGVRQSRGEAVAEGRKTERVLLGFVALVVCGGLGVGAGVYATRGELPNMADLADIAVTTTEQSQTNRRGNRWRPSDTTDGQTQIAAAVAPAPAVAAQTPSTAELVTRSINTLMNAPLDASVAPSLEPVPVAVEEEEAEAFDATSWFTAASGASNAGCVADLQNLVRDTRIYFPSGGLTPDDGGMARARLIGQIGQSCPGVVIQVQGHSDPSGDPAVNLRLSQQRAQMVVDRIKASGVDTGMLQAVGMGDRQPSGITGPEPAAHYDRRVEFSVVLTSGGAVAQSPAALATALNIPACVTDLQVSSRQIQVEYSPNAVTASENQLLPVYRLADALASCPGTRLRITGQFAEDAIGSETPSTARIRAIAMMTTLVSTGVAAEQILVSAPSSPTVVDGLNDRRIDIEVVFDDS